MSQATPLISICLPNLNKRRFLPERMETLLAQTFSDWELIVCDSYSNDGSWEYLEKFKTDPRIKLHQVPREGIYAGWNECLRRAQGQYIYIATSDDTCSPNILESLLKPLERRPEIALSVCDYSEIDSQSRPIKERLWGHKKFLGEWLNTPAIRNGKTEFLLHAVFGSSWTTIASVLFRRKLLDQIGMFRRDLGSAADSEWSLRATLASDIASVPGQLTTWRIDESQATPLAPDWNTYRLARRCLELAMDDPKAGIPEAWKSLPGWREKILTKINFVYLDSFQLYRWAARENPRKFLTGMTAAARLEPKWLLHQALRGFPYQKDLDTVALAYETLEFFKAKWPPERVSAW